MRTKPARSPTPKTRPSVSQSSICKSPKPILPAAIRALPGAPGRTPSSKHGTNQLRWQRAGNDKAFDLIRQRIIIETRADTLLKVLQRGTVSTNIYLHRLHNFCLDMNWLPRPIIPKRQWPEIKFKEKRVITWEEHQKIPSCATALALGRFSNRHGFVTRRRRRLDNQTIRDARLKPQLLAFRQRRHVLMTDDWMEDALSIAGPSEA